MYIVVIEQNVEIWTLLVSKILLQEVVTLGRRKGLCEEEFHLKY